MPQFQDAFISYGRADSKAFAAKLNERLIAHGLEVWFDFEDIPLGVDYQKQIDAGIDHADNFLFVISPHSVNSPYCRLEIERALHYQKRIIPLLHVEEISHETWQQRHPSGTDAEWETYQSEGKHSSFANMHEAIAKINWVYCREGQDDFEPALQGLLAIFERQRSYVRQHTVLLTQAQTWERHQKQSRYLLIGDERRQAEDWLTTRFKTEQPPCLPTNLHAEFITESRKNGDNLMTQVFLAHADNDRELRDRFRQRLMRENITVWTSKTDIPTGSDFRRAIQQGIEAADNVVYLLSAAALASRMCQLEILYAQKLNKRIIPLLVSPIDPPSIPQNQLSLQFIDFSNNTTAEQYEKDVAKLLCILQQDAEYYSEYKLMLVKALKWQRQHRNPSILLRGYNLHHGEAWLKVAKSHSRQGPLPLQEEFIDESLRQPPAQSLEVFISYSRSDSEFARRINDALQIQGKTTWFDQESIASGADFQQEIYQGIATSDNFLFILSPRSVKSPYCEDEVAYAVSLNKRCVPILYHPVEPSDVPSALASVQWIDFTDTSQDFLSYFSQLVRTLDTDRDHVHSHTKWSQLAIAWNDKDRNPDLLLRGSELAIAQTWLQSMQTEQKQPAATHLQQDFIDASHSAEVEATEREHQRQVHLLELQRERTQEAEARLAEQKKYSRRQRLYLSGVSLAFVIACGLGIFAFILFGQAQTAKRTAERNAEQARINEQQAIYRQIEADSQAAEALFTSNHQLEALHKALEAGARFNQEKQSDANEGQLTLDELKDLQAKKEMSVIRALGSVLYGIRERNRLSDHTNIVTALSLSRDGQYLASASWDKTVRIWQYPTGELLQTLGGTDGQQDPVDDVVFSSGGETIASASEDNAVKTDGHQGPVYDVAFSPDGKTIASASEDNTVKLWSIDGELLHTLKSHDKRVQAVVFSNDGQTIISGSEDGTLKFWSRDGHPQRTVSAHGGEAVYDLAISPDGQTLASGGGDRTVQLWNLSGERLQTFPRPTETVQSPNQGGEPASNQAEGQGSGPTFGRTLGRTLGHTDDVYGVAFSPDGTMIASASKDQTIRLWDIDGTPKQELKGHRSWVYGVVFGPDGRHVASASGDRTVKFWQVESGRLIQTIEGHENEVWAIASGPENTESSQPRLISAGADNTVRIWSLQEELLTVFDVPKQGRHQDVRGVSFSPNGQVMASVGPNNAIHLWPMSSKQKAFGNQQSNRKSPKEPINTSPGHTERIYSLLFSPDGKTLVSTSEDHTAKVWSSSEDWTTDITLQHTLDGHQGSVYRAAFSPDSKTLITASQDQTLKVWDLATGTERQTLTGHGDRVYGVSVSPNGEWVASTGRDAKIQLWKKQKDGTFVYNSNLASTIENGQTIWNRDVTFSPDGQTVATAGFDKKVRIWNLEGDLLNTLSDQRQGHGARVYSVRFSPSGNFLASTSGDKTIKLWTADGTLLMTLVSHHDEVFDVAFHPDETHLASASADGTTILWRLELGLDGLLTGGCKWATSYLAYNSEVQDVAVAENDNRKGAEGDRLSICQ